MGKEEEQTPQDENNSANPVEPPKIENIDEEQNNESKPKDEKKNPEELRKIIKLNNTEDADKQKKQEPPSPNSILDELEDNSREALEQKRAILQSIKDFDFQIKKNSEEITSLNKKLDSVTKDLDDLVSLYEIVSEQMNPFVGLSKVTKKRIEALENFTTEVEDIKNRMNEIEEFAEKSGYNLKYLQDKKLKESNTTDQNKEFPKEEETDLDLIIETVLNEVDFDKELDNMINEFIESLKI
jgi:archaeal flagellar protein FlaC